MVYLNKLKDSLANLEEESVYSILKDLMSSSPDQAANALEICQNALTEVGNRFENGEYFIGDLLYSSEIMREAVKILRPALGGEGASKMGKMIICTVKDDIHDIGKGIVKGILEAGGFEVIDLGIDVPAADIVKAVKDNGVKIVALSCVLSLALNSMQNTVEEFVRAGIRDKVKIIIGGCPVTEDACSFIGADAWSNSPQKGADICRAWAQV